MLITLTIIGIIAALTVPSLMTKVQDHGFRSAMKKKYAEISTAIAKMNLDGNPFFLTERGCWGGTYTPNMEFKNNPEIFGKYFKVKKYADNHWEIYPREIITKIKDINGNIRQGYLEDYSSDRITLQLEDGSVMHWSASMSYVGFGEASGNQGIVVDVNGIKGPNQIGRDTYYFNVSFHNGQPVLQPRACHVDYAKTDCCLGKDKRGWGCATMILQNPNYKIEKCKS